MARSVIYRIAATGTGTAAGVSELTMPIKTRIYQIVIRQRAVGGAGVGAYTCEVNLNQSSNAFGESQYPVRFATLAAATMAVGNALGAHNNTVIPVNVPCEAGDRVCLGITQTGTAAASAGHFIDLYCAE